MNARDVLEVISALGGRAQLKNQCRRYCAHVEASDRGPLAVETRGNEAGAGECVASDFMRLT